MAVGSWVVYSYHDAGMNGEGTRTKVFERLCQGPGLRSEYFQKRLRESGTPSSYRKEKKGGKVWLVVTRDHVWQRADVIDAKHSLYSILAALPTKHHQKYHMRAKKNSRTYSRQLSRASGKLVVIFQRRG